MVQRLCQGRRATAHASGQKASTSHDAGARHTVIVIIIIIVIVIVVIVIAIVIIVVIVIVTIIIIIIIIIKGAGSRPSAAQTPVDTSHPRLNRRPVAVCGAQVEWSEVGSRDTRCPRLDDWWQYDCCCRPYIPYPPTFLPPGNFVS